MERVLLKGVATIYFWKTLIKDNGEFTLGGIFVQRYTLSEQNLSDLAYKA